jgi:hypothetical protein
MQAQKFTVSKPREFACNALFFRPDKHPKTSTVGNIAQFPSFRPIFILNLLKDNDMSPFGENSQPKSPV